MRPINGIYFLLFTSIILSIVYLHYGVTQTHTKLTDNFEKVFVEQAGQFATNIENELSSLLDSNKTLYTVLKENPSIREDLERGMSFLVTPSFKYVYLLYRDSRGKYRYLLDGSREDKGIFNQKLDVDKQKWNRCYETGKDQILMQKDLDGLWVTYLKPVVNQERVEGVIAIDFSTSLPTTIAEATKPIENIFLYIFAAIGILILILLYQTILNIRTKKESILDPLTGTYNRNYLKHFLKSINPARYQIMMIDIDHFKKINDNFGHKAGDMILQQVAQTIKEEVRKEDRVIRFGGEEFLVFLHKKTLECSAAQEISFRLKERIERRTFMYEDTPIHITVSIGITSNPEHFKDVPEAIKHADEMLYIAKREGRNKIIFDVHKKSVQNSAQKSISEVKEAIENDRITCYYQPIVDLESAKTVKYEALVRMIDTDGKIIAPYLFLDTIAYTSVYSELTKRIIEIVFKQIKRHRIPISINLNLSDILDNMIFAIITDEIQRNIDLADRLIIELLENEHNSDIENLRNRLIELKSYGVKISIDDFGSGFSNFSIFQDLPIDTLKIDGSLIKDIETSKIAYTITESIVLFARKLDIECVAEFVHNEAVRRIVKDLGVTLGQGYHLGKPEPEIEQKTLMRMASEISA